MGITEHGVLQPQIRIFDNTFPDYNIWLKARCTQHNHDISSNSQNQRHEVVRFRAMYRAWLKQSKRG